ncbi:unnamed protein product, partial [Laminaria digitata]
SCNIVSGYDGGDCCECTCVSTTNHECGASVHGGFACLDAGALCVDDDEVTTLPGPSSDSECVSEAIGDGNCDEDY